MPYHDTDRSYATPGDPGFSFPASPVAAPVSPPPPQYSGGDHQASYTPRYSNTGGGGAPVPSGGGAPAAPGAFPAASSVNPNDTPYWWMMSIPEVAGVINQAVSGGHDADWIKAHLQRTDWWKQNSESARNFLQLQSQDPATANQQIQQKMDALIAKADDLGLYWTPENVKGAAYLSITQNWDDRQVMQYLSSMGWKSDATQAGLVQAMRDKVIALSHQYGVPLSEETAVGLSKQAIFMQGGDIGGVQSYFANAAKSLYPAAAAAIDQGQTLQQFFDPYRQIAAKDLEVSPDSVDLSDPKWNTAINSVDPKTGNKFAMSLGDFETMIKTNPTYGYDHTLGARQQAADLAQNMLQAFGRQA